MHKATGSGCTHKTYNWPSHMGYLLVILIISVGTWTTNSLRKHKEFCEKSEALLNEGVIDQESLKGARIERYIFGKIDNDDAYRNKST